MPTPSMLPAVIDRIHYRNAMSRLAAAVNVITSHGAEGRCGFTASAVCSVTDTPPTLLVCMNRSVQSAAAIRASGILCVNTIGHHHEELSMAFAGAGGVKDMETRFGAGEWTTLATGAPVLADATVAFDCRVVEIREVGTHDVLFCEVVAIHHAEDHGGGLVYFDRAFHPVARRAPAAAG